ncbi:MAG: c-type cytochrome [Candidatus Omnitrophica bacterium]|nr:c-type cytochrome [Candidatus Omnitrophota bacterium]
MSSRKILVQLFFATSAGLVLLLGVATWRELNPEWGPYQKQYNKLLAQKTGNPKLAAAPLEIKQIHLPEFGRTDRCTTCHLGVDNPKMADAPQPFKTHPDFQTHPFEQFGCTVCHGGQGMAVSKEHAHGPVKHWEEPVLPNDMVVGSCLRCHDNLEGLKGAQRIVQAKRLFDKAGCIGCHTLNGWGGPVSPELSDTGHKPLDEFDFRYVEGRARYQWVYAHFKNPQAAVPGDLKNNVPPTAMPNYHLSDEEATMLTALVLGFSHEKIPPQFHAPGKPKETPRYADAVEAGRAVFQKYGCTACHGFQGRGGVQNYNAVTGGEVPPLTYAAKGFTKDQLKNLIREGRYPTKLEPRGPTPPLWMPAWKEKISPEELDQLVEYLVSLTPADQSTQEI